ncbi:MobF family relaxase [Vibrio parahaemolyticus]|uniref:TrwC relaxase domain-containing protein n=1 Tax=Vibrio parahaemolyticus TaxID=670 RepID=A0AAW3J024_VIBPH|nr:hypothetical protein ACX05_07115 [Vibrio parahaemolyticus]
MLTIFPIKNINYYSEWSQFDYYLNNDELPGIWSGYLAHLLGIKGEIGEEHFRNLMNGYSPDGKKAFVKNAGKERNFGYDLTFSAPKSVSILDVFDDSASISIAHDNAVQAALRFIEEKAAYTRRNAQGRESERIPGLLAALFTHFESRAEDMQLHTHCLILNLAIRHDLTWGTIQGQKLYQWMRASGAIYRAELAQNLRELGYWIEEDNDSFRVVGVPEHICKYFSKRDEQISSVLKKFNETTSASAIGDHVKLYTRDKKKKTPTSELNSRWQSELTTLGFSKERAMSIRSNEPTLAEKFCDIDVAFNELTQNKSIFREQDLYQNIAKQAQLSGDRAANIVTLSFRALSSDRAIILGLDQKENMLLSTSEIIYLEKDLIKLAKKMVTLYHPAPTESDFLITSYSKSDMTIKGALSEEQIIALQNACNNKKLSILQGSAGSGKSFSMKALRKAYEKSRQRVKGACIAKLAADNLENETGIKSQTIAKLLSDSELGKYPLKDIDVLVIDEAGQIGAKQMHSILSQAIKSNTKIVLVGEDKQLDAIEHGGVLSYLSRPDVIGTSRIETIRRQKDLWARQVVTNFRDGNALAALYELHKRDLVTIASSHDEAISQLVDRWKIYISQNKEKNAVVLAQKWTEVDQISRQLRKYYQEHGKVHKENIVVKCSVSGKVMTLPFSVGERVRFTKNDYRLGVTNGSFGQVEHIETVGKGFTFYVRLEDSRLVSVDESNYVDEFGNLPLIHAYAMTVYSSQGITVNGSTFILYNSHMGREATYVAGSRHKDHSHFFMNSKDVDFSIECDRITEKMRLDLFAQYMSRESKSRLAIEYWSSNHREQYEKTNLAHEVEPLFSSLES